MAYTWLNLNFTDQSSLLCGLSDMHCTSAFATEEGNAFESQNGVAVVQPSKINQVALVNMILDMFLCH